MILDVDLREQSPPPIEPELSFGTDSDFPLSLDGVFLESQRSARPIATPGSTSPERCWW